MRYLLLLLLATLVSCTQKVENVQASDPVITTLILVRHAEKQDDGSKDPNLTEAGVKRAHDLMALLTETKLDAIYSTPYQRTMNTVKPLAEATGLEIQSYEPMNEEAMDRLLAENLGLTLLISGHSNTTPWVANYFLGNETYQNFQDSDYDNVLVLSIVEKGNAKATRMTYGAPTN